MNARLREAFGDLVDQTMPPRSAPVESAHSRDQSVLDIAPRSAGVERDRCLARTWIGDPFR